MIYSTLVPMPRAALGALVALLLSWVAATAQAQTVLTLRHGAELLELSLEDLEALPQATLVTANEFTDGEVTYRGPLARDVLEQLALDGLEAVRFIAINDYYIDIPTSDLHSYDVILALEADGERLSRRDKGPLWLMYPLSEYPELRGPTYNARLIWQVVRIEAL